MATPKMAGDKRPVNLDLTTVSFPITAIASILHRICAVITWVALAYLLIILSVALSSTGGLDQISQGFQSNFFLQFLNWGFLSAFAYYCMGTLKHIIQDFGFCEDFEGGKIISWLAIVFGVFLAILAGVLVWA